MPADTYKTTGSLLRRAFDDWRNNQGRKIAWVEAVSEVAAIATYRAHASGGDEFGYAADTGTLPLQIITAQAWGRSQDGTKIVYRITADYSPWGAGGVSAQSSRDFAEFRSATEEVTIYTVPTPPPKGEAEFDAYGFPVGKPSTPSIRNYAFRPIPRRMFRPVVRMELATTLTSNPIGTVAGLLKTINAQEFEAGGYLFAPKTVRFDDCIVRVSQAGSTVKFGTVYAFVVCVKGWYEQVPDFRIPPNETVPRWVVDTVQQYPTASFANAFPFAV